MSHRSHMRVPALALVIAVLLAVLSLPALAAGPKRIFVTKLNENNVGQANVTFELYQDADGDGVLDPGETKLQTEVTDAAGKATFDPVNPGNYIVHEVTPPGYTDHPDKAVTIPNAKGPGPQVIFFNTPKPEDHRVNDPTSDVSIDDGTHVFDFGATIAAGPGEDVLVGWNDSTGFHPPGDVSGISTSFSTQSGASWGSQVVGIPTGSQSSFYLGQPSVAFDPTTGTYLVAADAVMATQQGLTFPILVSRSGAPSGFWNNPVNTFPGITPDPAFAHGPDINVDPATGTVYVGYTVSLGDGTSEVLVSRSTDGGATFKPPVSVSERGTFDHVDLEAARNGRLYVTYTNFGGSGSTTYDILIRRSTDGGKTFGPAFPIRTASPKSGTVGECTGSATGRTVLGSIAVFNEADTVVDPRDPSHLFSVYPIHGPGGDESDVYYTESDDGGKTWSAPELVGQAEGTQWAGVKDMTPDGRVAIAYYQSVDGTKVDPTVVFHDPYSDEFVGAPQSLTDGNPFELWDIDPSFDTDYVNCFGLGEIAMAAPGSGFYFAWTDGRDPGPAGNNGIDPNIYFANHLGPFLGTTTTLKISTTASKIKPSGTVSPPPLKGAIVKVTLFVDDGPGGFQQVASKSAKTKDDGSYSASFARPGGGTCRITVVFEGSEGRAPSPSKSKTFAC